jgi:hypothetical protein
METAALNTFFGETEICIYTLRLKIVIFPLDKYRHTGFHLLHVILEHYSTLGKTFLPYVYLLLRRFVDSMATTCD